MQRGGTCGTSPPRSAAAVAAATSGVVLVVTGCGGACGGRNGPGALAACPTQSAAAVVDMAVGMAAVAE
eukprot:349874-Chlamydomonas_euryale.AAC.1